MKVASKFDSWFYCLTFAEGAKLQSDKRDTFKHQQTKLVFSSL